MDYSSGFFFFFLNLPWTTETVQRVLLCLSFGKQIYIYKNWKFFSRAITVLILHKTWLCQAKKKSLNFFEKRKGNFECSLLKPLRWSCTTNSNVQGTSASFRTLLLGSEQWNLGLLEFQASSSQEEEIFQKKRCIPSAHVFSSDIWLLINDLGGNNREARKKVTTL